MHLNQSQKMMITILGTMEIDIYIMDKFEGYNNKLTIMEKFNTFERLT